MRIGFVFVVLALGLQAAFAQRAGPPPQPASIGPRPTANSLAPPAPPPEISQPEVLVRPVELPKPVGKQCIRERVAPCTSDPKRECKVMEIAEC
jgi:hypothetical protein